MDSKADYSALSSTRRLLHTYTTCIQFNRQHRTITGLEQSNVLKVETSHSSILTMSFKHTRQSWNYSHFDDFVALLRLNLRRMTGETRYQTSDAELELTVLGGVDERVDTTVGEHQRHGEVVEPEGQEIQEKNRVEVEVHHGV